MTVKTKKGSILATPGQYSLFDLFAGIDTLNLNQAISSQQESPIIEALAASDKPLNWTFFPANFIPKSDSARLAANLRAIEAVRSGDSTDKDALMRFVGWGGLANVFNGIHFKDWQYCQEQNKEPYGALASWVKEYSSAAMLLKLTLTPDEYKAAESSTLTAYYTPPALIEAMWKGVQRLGFQGGDILEPACGIGYYLGLMPEELVRRSRVTAVEKDKVSGQICQMLFPDANVQIGPFEGAEVEPESFDLVITNVPFGQLRVSDANYRHLTKFDIHNYFIGKSALLLREGGIMAVVTSTGTMDNKDAGFRQWLASEGRMELAGGFRLPSGYFKADAGTEVSTDVLFLVKQSGIARRFNNPYGRISLIRSVIDTSLDLNEPARVKQILANEYYEQNPGQVLGNLVLNSEIGGGMYRGDHVICHHEQPASVDLTPAIEALPELDTQRIVKIKRDKEKAGTYTQMVKIGSHMYRQSFIIEKYEAIKTAYFDLRSAEGGAQSEAYREALTAQYDTFVAHFGVLSKNKALKFLYSYDPYFALIQALEVQKGGRWVKSDIFFHSLQGEGPITTVSSLEDAITLSAWQYGYLHTERMGEWLSISAEEVIERLIAANHAFRTPGQPNRLIAKTDYLSGNVVEKIKAAQSAAQTDSRFERNVEALEAARPMPIPFMLLTFTLSSSWIPTEVFTGFVQTVLKIEKGVVTYNERSRLFELKECDYSGSVDNKTLGTKELPAHELFEKALNGRSVNVTKTVYGEDGKPKQVNDPEATAEAIGQQEALNELFTEYVTGNWQSAVEAAYNETFNVWVDRPYELPQKQHYPGAVTSITLRKHQKRGVERIKAQDTCLAHGVGSGKAQPLDANVLTPDGWKKMGDIQIGDQVISVDGKPTCVTGVFPQGEKEIFEVIFSDGSKAECCEEHLWLTQTYYERTKQSHSNTAGKSWDCAKAKVRSLKEIRDTLVGRMGVKNHSIPLVNPVAFNEKPLLIHPYLLGILLGDGSLSGKYVGFSSADEEIITRITELVPDSILVKHIEAYDYRLQGKEENSFKNCIRQSLKLLGLMEKTAADKFIPTAYLINSTEKRIRLLQGLIDSDGYADERKNTLSYTTISTQLAKDVVALVQSLGGVATVWEKESSYSYKGERKKGKKAYTITINLPETIPFTTLARKQNKLKPRTHSKPTRYIVEVRSVGRKYAQCISVAHDSRLYVTDDYIVTHNTYTIVTGAMELKRLKLANKSLVVVQNSTLENFVESWKGLYPDAAVMYPTASDFSKEGRRVFLQRVAHCDVDAVVIPQSMMRLIPDELASLVEFISEEAERMEALMEAEESRRGTATKRTVKRLNALKERIEARRSNQALRKTDDMLSFEQLGIDALFIDEAHNYKRLGLVTNRTRIKGIDTQGSEQALSAMCKIRSVQNRGGRVVLATGTPISNTMAEAWTLLRYVAPDRLKTSNIDTFDHFAGSFGQVVPSFELTPTGQFKAVERFAKFINVRTLIDIFRSHVDIVLNDEVDEFKLSNGSNLIPALKDGKYTSIQLDMTDEVCNQLNRIKATLEWFEKLSGKDKRDNGHIPLVMFGQARKVTIDPRLIDPRLAGETNGKLMFAAREIYRLYTESNDYNGTQLVFSDVFQSPPVLATSGTTDLYSEDGEELAEGTSTGEYLVFNAFDELKRLLVNLGIPEHEIATTPQQAEKREAVFAKVRTGAVRVLMGSTERMGVGVNVQDRVCGIHHLDAPNRPTDFEQRNGRGLRQGNMLATMGRPMEILTYGVRRTMDATAYGRLALKQKFINQLLKGQLQENTCTDVSGEDEFSAMSFDEMMATLSGSQTALLYVSQRLELNRLEQSEKNYIRRMKEANWQIYQANTRLKDYSDRLPKVQAEEMVLNNHFDKLGTVTTIEIDGEVFTTEFGKALKPVFEKIHYNFRRYGSGTAHIKVNGVLFTLKGNKRFSEGQTEAVVEYYWGHLDGVVQVPGRLTQSIEISISRFFGITEHTLASIDRQNKLIEQYSQILSQPFAGAEQLTILRGRVKELERQLQEESGVVALKAEPQPEALEQAA